MDLPARIGRYEVELLLGEGEVGRVLLARDPVLRRQVALKVLRDDLGLLPEQRAELTERVREQVRAASTLSHPAMVAVHDMGDDERVGLYVVFELVRGPTLRERLHEGPLPTAEVAQIARTLGSVLTHAHAAGLVHRGVKPENVMLASTGPKLTDFGLSRGDPRASVYSAAEAVASDSLGAQEDQFSLAATMYEALTGQRAFPVDGEAATAAARGAAGEHAPPRSVLPALRGFLRLDAVFARALAGQPKKRFASCDAFGSALAAELEGPRVTFLATSWPGRSNATRATRRWQNGIALLAVVVIVALVLIGRLHQPSVDGVSLKNVASAYAGGRTPERGEGGDRKPATPMQRVVPTSHLIHPSASSAPSPSATSSASAGILPPSSSVPVGDP